MSVRSWLGWIGSPYMAFSRVVFSRLIPSMPVSLRISPLVSIQASWVEPLNFKDIFVAVTERSMTWISSSPKTESRMESCPMATGSKTRRVMRSPGFKLPAEAAWIIPEVK